MPPKDRFKQVRERDPFRWTQATHAIRFKYLRNGMVLNPTADQVAAYLDPTQRQDWRVAPPKGKLPRVDPSWLPVPHMFDSSNAPRPYALLGGQNPRIPADRRATATQAFNEVTRSLAEIGFQYIKTLGWGGNGVAAMYQYESGDGSIRTAVAKIQYAGTLETERTLVTKLRGQQHILQRLQAADLNTPFDSSTVLRVLSEQRLTLFEFARYGSLQSLLHRNGDPNAGPSGQKPLPNRVLVEIFRCLTKACIDMESPPQQVDGQFSLPIVHLDLEPSNVLFTDLDRTEHLFMPKLKVADFGIAAEIRRGWMDLDHATNWVWDLRWRGKTLHFLPEQFSQDWDFVDKHPFVENINTYGPVAGHFGPPSNIYHVGLIMWSCITGCWPRLPSHPEQGPFAHPDGRPFWTYGASELDKFANSVDNDIRCMVIACLVEEPARRIAARDLLKWADMKLAHAINGDDQVTSWVQAKFKGAPQPSRQELQTSRQRYLGIDQIDPFARG